MKKFPHLTFFRSVGSLAAAAACVPLIAISSNSADVSSEILQTAVSDAAVEPSDNASQTEKPLKIEDELWEIMESADDDELIPVSLWIRDIDFDEVNRKAEERVRQLGTDDVQVYITEQRKIAKEMFDISNGDFIKSYLSGAEELCTYGYFPIVDCSVTKEKILYLAGLSDVQSISCNDAEYVTNFSGEAIIDC